MDSHLGKVKNSIHMIMIIIIIIIIIITNPIFIINFLK